MEQRSPEWHSHRKLHANASEAGAVIKCNPWKPRNPDQLLQVKLGNEKIFVNKAMKFGTFYEDEALAALEAHTGVLFNPEVMSKTHNNVPYSASLDGLEVNFEVEAKRVEGGTDAGDDALSSVSDASRKCESEPDQKGAGSGEGENDSPDTAGRQGLGIAEIKCPFKGKESKLWLATLDGKIPKYYLAQMEQQMFVSGATYCHFFVYTPTDKSFLHQIIESDLELRAEIISKWEEFWPTYAAQLKEIKND